MSPRRPGPPAPPPGATGVPDDGPNDVPDDVLAAVAADSSLDAGRVPVALLGDFLPALVAAVGAGETLPVRQLRAHQGLGADAARQGVALRALLDLHLSAAWRLWRHLPVVVAGRDAAAVARAGEVMLHAADDVVAALTEGYQLARRSLVRAQESTRREFVDDLLTGVADVAGLLARAAGFGLDLSGPYAVALVAAEADFRDDSPVVGSVQRAVQGRRGDAEVLVASKEGRLVVVFAAPDRAAVEHVVDRTVAALGPRPGDADEDRVHLARRYPVGRWQLTVGRPGIGPDGVATSYREARAGHDIAARLGLDVAVVDARDLLVHRLLLRDRPAIEDLVVTLLAPLGAARGGAEPLLATLAAFFDAGGNAALTARALHLSVRAVTYRLARIAELTGHDPADPAERFGLQAAVLGARLLDWPATPLARPGS